MAKVKIRDPREFEKKLALFENLCKKEGSLREVQNRQAFASKGDKVRKRGKVSASRLQNRASQTDEE